MIGIELKVGDEVVHIRHGAGIVIQIWNGRAVVQLEEGGVGTFAVSKLTRKGQAPDLEELTV